MSSHLIERHIMTTQREQLAGAVEDPAPADYCVGSHTFVPFLEFRMGRDVALRLLTPPSIDFHPNWGHTLLVT